MTRIIPHLAGRVLRAAGYYRGSFKVEGSEVSYLCGGNPDGPVVVVYPGYGDTPYSWTLFLLSFGRHARIFAIDWPGFGGFSDAPEKLDFDFLERVSQAFLRDVVGHADFVIGNSLGGWLAIRSALADPARVGHLIAVNPGGVDTGEEELLELLETFRINSYRDFVRLLKKLFMKVRPEFYAVTLLGSFQHVRNPRFHELLQSVGRQHFVNEQLGTLKMPLSLVWGEYDGVFGGHIAAIIREKAPACSYYPLRCGHMPQLESWGDFERVVNRIVKSKAPQAAAKVMPGLRRAVILKSGEQVRTSSSRGL